MTRDFRRDAHEQWSERNQTLRHAGEKRPRDDQALLQDPADYSAVGGPEDERVYGHSRSDNGHYPWNSYGGAYDRDTPAGPARGGFIKPPGEFSRARGPSFPADDPAPPPDRDSAPSAPQTSG